jgi:hypothetical protein
MVALTGAEVGMISGNFKQKFLLGLVLTVLSTASFVTLLVFGRHDETAGAAEALALSLTAAGTWSLYKLVFGEVSTGPG